MLFGIVLPALVCFAVVAMLPIGRPTRDIAVTGVLVVATVSAVLTGQRPWVVASLAALTAIAGAVTIRRVAGDGPTSERDRNAV